MNQIICTVDVALLTLAEDGLKVGLLRREREPFKSVAALPGGYIHQESDNDARDAARRVLMDKAGIDPPYLEQLATFSGPARDPRGWSVSIAYYALVPAQLLEQAGERGMTLASADHPPQLPFDHRAIVAAAVARLRSKSQYSSLPCHLAGETFTLPQLQKVYETLMNEPLNKVSFRRKMTEMDMLDPVEGRLESAGAHRPAQVYRLKAAFRDELQLLERGL
ncbi:NUDIX hydrolase [Oxalobacteraceae bacterium]|nr:NUDIX hydrolase [Oxalobacteraceae bacterium]